MKERITKSNGNVFIDLGFPPEEAAVLAMRAQLMARLRALTLERGWTQMQAAKRLGITQSRVSDLVRGKWKQFSLDMLVVLAARVGQQPSLTMKETKGRFAKVRGTATVKMRTREIMALTRG